MLEAELQRLRDDNTAIAELMNELAAHLAQPLPPEPPFQIMADVTALQDRLYAMARQVGNMKRRSVTGSCSRRSQPTLLRTKRRLKP